MALIGVTATAAVAIAGYDLMTNNILKTVNKNRRIRRAGLTGSSAAGVGEVRILAGGNQIANILVSATGAVQADSAMCNVNEVCPANQPLTAQMVTGATTNPAFLVIETD